MAQFTKENAKEFGAKGGRAKAENYNKLTKTFEDVVKESITDQDLKELYSGLLAAAKRGNAKALDILLGYYNKTIEEEDNEFDRFIEDF